MTRIYFIRHAEPNYNNHRESERELTLKGIRDAINISNLFANIHVDHIFSSPAKRTQDTLQYLAQSKNKPILICDQFRERKITNSWIENFDDYAKRQWMDFDYKLPLGESLRETQYRNIVAIEHLLDNHPNETIVIGSHGTALCTIINYYNPNFGYDDFERIKKVMPWIVRFDFDNDKNISIEEMY